MRLIMNECAYQLYCRYIKRIDSAEVHLKFLCVILHTVCKCFDHFFFNLVTIVGSKRKCQAKRSTADLLPKRVMTL